MFVLITTKRRIIVYLCIFGAICLLLWLFIYFRPSIVGAFIGNEISEDIQYIFDHRSQAILKQDLVALGNLYDRATKYGVWAFEHELKKMKYLHRWSQKQGVQFLDIQPKIIIRRINPKGEGFTVNLTVSTTYKYAYLNEKQKINLFRIGTYHSMDIVKRDDTWVILREWYTDPFADSLHFDEIKTEEAKEYILSQSSRNFTSLSERRVNAVAYADRYCGAAGEIDYSYNKKYRNYNPLGGDCANFASQILYEGGKFRKNPTWNYDKGGSKAWVNAHAFKNYMVYSGRASVIAYGNYEKVYKASYKLLPGDFVAYERKGKVVHISVVTGADSKGYTLVNSHNTDRYRVPWDLGWSDKEIKFWLVRVHF